MTYNGINEFLQDELLRGALFKPRYPAIGEFQPEIMQRQSCLPLFFSCWFHCCEPRFLYALQNASLCSE